MSAAPEMIDETRKLRSSIILLILSCSGIFYYTYVDLNYDPVAWNSAIGIVSVILFIISLILIRIDWLREKKQFEIITDREETKVANMKSEPIQDDVDDVAPASRTSEDSEISSEPDLVSEN